LVLLFDDTHLARPQKATPQSHSGEPFLRAHPTTTLSSNQDSLSKTKSFEQEVTEATEKEQTRDEKAGIGAVQKS
jgi:hypothetical protein